MRNLILVSLVGVISSTVWGVEPIFPPPLQKGDTLSIIVPGSPVKDPELSRCVERYRELGFQVNVPSDVFRSDDYLAGTDQRRVDEIMAAFKDPKVKAIIAARGGYGCTRLIDKLDYDVIRTHPKIVCGFSDVTALHLAIFRKTGLVTFHTPVPTWGMGNEEGMRPLTAHWYWRALMADRYPAGEIGYKITSTWPGAGADAFARSCDFPPATTMVGGTARGRLIGGNLSLIAALSGTPYEMQTKGRILFIEDVGESPYKVDRMLCTLRLAGKLDDLAGVVVGSFTRRADEDTKDEVRTLRDVLEEYLAGLGVPVIYNFPSGHHVCNVTLPLGAMYEINADDCSLTLLENPVALPGQPAS